MTGRGRPKGAVRWTKFSDCHIWAHITLIRETEGRNVSDAARLLASRGFNQFQSVRPGEPARVWVSNEKKVPEFYGDAITEGWAIFGDKRNDDPAETFRARYYFAERRRRNDPEFKADCDFWLACHRRAKELQEEGMSAADAGFQAMLETPDPRP